MSHGDSTAAWDRLDATHVTGDLHYVEQYPKSWWLGAAVACLLLPPVGVFAVVYMAVSNLFTDPEQVDAEMDAAPDGSGAAVDEWR